MFLGNNALDDDQRQHHQDNGDGQANPDHLQQSGQDKGNKGNTYHRDRIGQLGGHMKQMIREKRETYRDYVRERIKEHLGNPVANNILAQPLKEVS